MTVRADLAAAATVVTGVNVTEFYRQSLKPGDGFVRYAGRKRSANGFGWIDTWEVWTAIPANLPDAEKWLEDNLPAVVDALDTVMVVATATPAEMALGTTTVNGVIIAGTTAA